MISKIVARGFVAFVNLSGQSRVALMIVDTDILIDVGHEDPLNCFRLELP
jgi:hypothetical protein